MSEIAGAQSLDSRAARSEPRKILRFRTSERRIHWATALPFIVCYTTALVLIAVYNPNPTRPFRSLVSLIHRMSGLCLLVAPLVTIVRHRDDIGLHRANLAAVWRWTRDDVRWLSLIVPASFSRNIRLPHQGKFNAGEKINFLVLTSTYPLYAMTGLAIWFGLSAYLAWMVHFSLATLATPLIIGHILMATVNPDTRPGLAGMITGLVDREWAKHHYHHWYEEHYGARQHDPGDAAVDVAAAARPRRAEAPDAAAPAPAAAVCPCMPCRVEAAVTR